MPLQICMRISDHMKMMCLRPCAVYVQISLSLRCGRDVFSHDSCAPNQTFVSMRTFTDCCSKMAQSVFKIMVIALHPCMDISCDSVQYNMLPACRPYCKAHILPRSIIDA